MDYMHSNSNETTMYSVPYSLIKNNLVHEIIHLMQNFAKAWRLKVE
jgi:hypothetical protein